ncbi:class I SAM-dependent methyltransferase [Schlesneria sp. T3-172]|uniref:class I SAM-dependent methyltransferase n=1 Tax=Schlesneria sphaerica TaxID=3373610 RepID=UPI0037CB2ED7
MNSTEDELTIEATNTPNWIDRAAKKILFNRLRGMNRGEVTVEDGSAKETLGVKNHLSAVLHIHRCRFYRDAVCGGALSVAESYLRGDWDCDQLTSLFRILIRNADATARLSGGLAHLTGVFQRLYHRWHYNSKSGSRRNIAAHYDLGNDFFKLCLDESMAYSSGIFLAPNESMKDASIEKIDRLCRKLDLRPQDHLLEIGSGWGGLAIHAAHNYGCRVTTTTISHEQFRLTRNRIDQHNLSDKVTVIEQDYRDVTGTFDKLVSVEMIEAVGYAYFDAYFKKCASLLKPSGTMAIQAIVLPERDYETYLRNTDFIQRYIFPGGCLPSLGAMLESVGRVTDLRFVHAEDFAPHYAETLRQWRRVFHEQLPEIRRQGFPERFLRMWHYYFCYCEAVFEERAAGVIQVQFDKPDCRRDPLLLSTWAAETSHMAARFKRQSNSFAVPIEQEQS